MITNAQALQIVYTVKNEIRDVQQRLNATSMVGLLDMFGGGAFTSLLKRGGMVSIENKLYHIQDLVTQLFDYNIYFVNEFDGHHGQFMDVMFDNIFSDLANQSRLNQAEQSLNRLSYQIDALIMRLQHQY